MNKVILMGRLTADPELRQTKNNVATCRFTVAVDRPYQKDKEKQADFITCVAWRGTAEFLCKYFAKGKMILLEGKIMTGSYDDKDGKKVYTFEVWADNVDFCGDKGGDKPVSKPATAPIPANLNDFEEIISDKPLPF